jgi:hypothetical protein
MEEKYTKMLEGTDIEANVFSFWLVDIFVFSDLYQLIVGPIDGVF